MRLAIIPILLLAPSAYAADNCTVKVDIPELVQRYGTSIQHACGPGIKSVSITGDHKRLVFEIVYVADLDKKPIAGTPMHANAVDTARASWNILESIYSMEEFVYLVRDGAGRKMCATKIDAQGAGMTACVTNVGDAERAPEEDPLERLVPAPDEPQPGDRIL